MDGIPYDINFFQDFSSMYVEGLLLTGVLVTNLIEAIDYLVSKTASPSAGYFPQKGNDRYVSESSHFDWDYFEEQQKRERKQEKKWKKTHRKIKSKDANYNFDLIYEDLLGDLL